MPKKTSATTKLPRTIAGIRINKDLRSAIAPVLRFAGHPMVSDILAGALVAGAESLIKDTKGPGGSKRKGTAAAERGEDNPIGLVLAIAAGAIASHIVTAYGAAPKARKQPSKAARSTSAKAQRRVPPPRK